MKVFLSCDMEGTAGIVDWEQCVGSGPSYEIGRRLLLAEVNAAIDGAVDGGATEIVVNDSHWTMQNLPPDELHGGASYLSGRHKPLYMMQGLDGTFDAAFYVSYHGSVGESSILSHTYNPEAVSDVRLNGEVAGEGAINALVAMHHDVPVALVTGDDVTAEESKRFLPSAECVVVKRSVTRYAAHNLHPEEACRLIREGAQRALERARSLERPAIDLPARLEVTFHTGDMAAMAEWIRGVERTGSRTVAMVGDRPLDLYRAFVATIYLTRSAEGR